MDLDGKRFVVAGATGGLGSLVARELAGAGAYVALAGRDRGRLDELSAELDAPSVRFDARDPGSCVGAVTAAAGALGGLDGVVVSCGVAAFGEGGELGSAALAELFAVNALGPIALVDAALDGIEPGGVIAGVSAIVAEHPTPGIAAYSAAKAAFSTYLKTVRRERRKDPLTVMDVRPPHMGTGFSDRPLAGQAPPLPEPLAAATVAQALIGALRDGRRELAWDLKAGDLVAR